MTSQEEGIILLDMIVCRLCYEQAIALGLDGEEIGLDPNFREQSPVAASMHQQLMRSH